MTCYKINELPRAHALVKNSVKYVNTVVTHSRFARTVESYFKKINGALFRFFHSLMLTLGGWENSRKLCKTTSRVCITVLILPTLHVFR